MQSSGTDTDFLASSNLEDWQIGVVREYLANSERENDAGEESDEAMSTESEPDDDDENDDENDEESIITAFSAIVFHDLKDPSDIDSDDSAFSTDDEYAEAEDLERQQLWRHLVLGRVKPSVLLREEDLVAMHEEYLRQLDRADEELAELKGAPLEHAGRQPDSSRRHCSFTALCGSETDAIVRELRLRSKKEIANTPDALLVRGAVLLAQALFRKEREIKRLYPEDGMDCDDAASHADEEDANKIGANDEDGAYIMV